MGSSHRTNWDYDPTESALSQVPKTFHEPEDFRKRLASSIHYHVLDVGRNAPIRLPQQMRDAQLPGPNGEDLVSCLYRTGDGLFNDQVTSACGPLIANI